MRTQIPFNLPTPQRPHDEHFIPHSGVIEAITELRSSLQKLRAGENTFFYYQLLGPAGAGKSYILDVLREEATCEVNFLAFDAPLDWSNQDLVARFIDAYETLKSNGGLLVVVSPGMPENPHVQSRLNAAVFLELQYPREEELLPLVNSLLAKRGLKFDESKLSYLLSRLPADPLSLSGILAKIDALSLIEGKQPTRNVIREVLSSYQGIKREGKLFEKGE